MSDFDNVLNNMEDFEDVNPEGAFMQQDNYGNLQGQQFSPRTFVSRPTSTEKLERAKSEIFEARLDLSPDTNSISSSMISMKLNYDGYGNNKIHHNYDGDSNNKIHHDYYSCINDFLANHNDTTSMTLKIPILHNDHANANGHGHTNRNKNTVILPSDNIEEVVRVLDQYFDTTDGISYEFSYYDCSWTVVCIDDVNYNVYAIGIFQDAPSSSSPPSSSSSPSNGKTTYYIRINWIDGDGYDNTNFTQDITSLFYETDEVATKSSADAQADMDTLYLQLFGPSKEDDDEMISKRVDQALDLLNDQRLSKYEMSEAITILLSLSSNETARKSFTYEVLLALLSFLQSIEMDHEMLLVSTRCVMIFYNLSSSSSSSLLFEQISSNIINPTISHFLKVAVNKGTIYDQEMRLKAAKTIENLLLTSIDVIDKKMEILEWLNGTILIKDKEILLSTISSAKLDLKGFKATLNLDLALDDGLGERTISGRN